MSFLIDEKNDLGSFLIPTGAANDVTSFSAFYVQPPGFTDPIFSVEDSGDIILGDPLNPTPIVINANVQYKFTQLSGTDANYLLTTDDYAIEVMSNTYNTITLPTATGIGGRTYVISRGSTTNNNLALVAQGGENIDGRSSILLPQQGDHLMVMSNDLVSWYIL